MKRDVRLHLAALALSAALLCAAGAAACHRSSPTSPDLPVIASITAVRYERVKPVAGDETTPVVVSIWYALARGDPYNRTTARLCVLERRGPATFICPAPRFEAIPTGREWSAQISDLAVSALPVARDLYLNGTRTRVEVHANGAESAVFQIGGDGRVW